MQMRAIEAFLILYEERSFTKASRRLFLTQQGLSRQIQSLEKELGRQLFERGRMGAEPTETAHMLYPYYHQINEIYQASAAVLESAPGRSLPLRVGFAIGISSAGDPDFLLEYQRLHPELVVEIQEWSKDRCIRKLLQGKLDVAFLVNPFPENLFRSVRIASDHMYAAMHKAIPWRPSGGCWISVRWTASPCLPARRKMPCASFSTTAVCWTRSIPRSAWLPATIWM